MGHISYLRKQFKSINTYDYITTFIKGKPLLTYCEFIGSSFNKLESPSSKDAQLCQVWLKFA